MAEGPESSTGDRDRLVHEPALKGYHLLPSVRGDLLTSSAAKKRRRAAFEAAAAMAGNTRERKFAEAREPTRRPRSGVMITPR